MAGGDRRELDENPEPTAVRSPGRRSDDWLHAIRRECRQRAQRKSAWAKRIQTQRHKGKAHQAIRADLKMTVEYYKRVRRWMDDAIDESDLSEGVISFEEALLLHEDRQVELVSRFAILKRAGANRDTIRKHLGLSHDGYDATSEWYRDALAGVQESRVKSA